MDIDWKLKLMQVLNCIGEVEGTIFDTYWADYGVSENEQQKIMKELNSYYEKDKN